MSNFITLKIIISCILLEILKHIISPYQFKVLVEWCNSKDLLVYFLTTKKLEHLVWCLDLLDKHKKISIGIKHTPKLPLWLQVQQLPKEAFVKPHKIVFDFIKDGITEEEANVVGMSWNTAIAIQPHWIMAHIAVEMGIFESVSQARKNGWNKPIETGYSERGGLGKRKNLCYFIWNPVDE